MGSIKKILVADDCCTNRLLIEMMLKRIDDFDIKLVSNGIEAVEKCESEDFDLIFMDIQMPKMGGMEATKHIKAIKPHIIIFSMTAMNDEYYDSSVFDGLLQKPFTVETIRQDMKSIELMIQ